MVLRELKWHMKKNETRPPTYTIHKNKLKIDKRLKYKSWQHKSSRGEHRKISDIPCSKIFTDMSPRARDIKERINKWDYIKLKGFCTAKENISKIKKERTIWESVIANDTSDKGLISKIYKELPWLHTRKMNNPIKKMGKGPEQTLLQGGYTEGSETYERMLDADPSQQDPVLWQQ